MGSFINQDDIIRKCTDMVFDITEQSFDIKFNIQDNQKSNGANASIIKKQITIKNDWEDLFSEDAKIRETALHTLYYTVGHEIGHKDKQPLDIMAFFLIVFLIMPFSAFIFYIFLGIQFPLGITIVFIVMLVLALGCYITNKPMFSSQLMEIRADYCGVIFAQRCIYGEQKITKAKHDELIEEIFGYKILQLEKHHEHDNGDHAHPSFKKRRDYLLKFQNFDTDFLLSFSKEYPIFGKLAPLYKVVLFKGKLLKLQHLEVTNG